MLKQLPVNMLWVSEDLSRLARLSLTSFLRHGFRVTLWSYEPKAHAMCGAVVRDAAELVPEGADGNLTYSYLSSLFRYRVLADLGGVWSDMDVVALTDSPDIPAAPLVASEKRRPFRHAEPNEELFDYRLIETVLLAQILRLSGARGVALRFQLHDLVR